ncbi:hypothetical protein GCM10028796_51020 [Ramlibacter monticola]|uniref:DEAD/DEAH box helicase n=1 Tax=Ramlibacter monticola TaxID=1926872 RepID=A0A936ZD99_9BURK|nr:DEAD/DEAH box helicase [Ramlibacter monticola]MBL0395305.1 DEAD/DEAH box helicase [Ramlibacter monticola]
MFTNIFRKKAAEAALAAGPSAQYDLHGIVFTSPAGITAEWLAEPYSFGSAADLGSRLAQIHAEGFGEQRVGEFVLPWADVYSLLRHPEFSAYRTALGIPAESSARPRILSRGAMMDADFTVLVEDWVEVSGRPMRPAPKLTGRVLQAHDTAMLVPESVHELLSELAHFHATQAAERTLAFKEQAFGRIRKLALASGCPVSDYVARTIVLTPDRLRMSLDRRGEGDTRLIEVIPGFEDAPAGWIQQFDRLPLQDSYNVPDGPALVRVVITPEVKAVLAEVKRMPGRRVAGARAEAFARNPFALLGESAHNVLDPAEFEEALEAAGIRLETFQPHIERGPAGEVQRVGLLIEAHGAASVDSEIAWFEAPAELERFTDKLDRCIEDGSQCVTWSGHELEIVGHSPDHLAQLRVSLREWRCPRLWTATEVLDLGNYSDRISGIGVETSFVVPVIARNDEGQGWFPDNVTLGFRVDDPEAPSPRSIVPITFGEIPSLRQSVDVAAAAGLPDVRLPGLEAAVPIADARRAVEALERAQVDLLRREFNPGNGGKPEDARTRLVIKRNLEEVDYTEQRAEALAMPPGRAPVVPLSMRSGIALKPHQQVGVAWLQHLWQESPTRCRGTVLADDMGLGKTLQLLTFIVSCFEAEPELPPALVVAPVALLENWRNELARFFEPGTLPLLLLYGDTLRELRVSRQELDEDLKHQGITRLLKKNWVGESRLVLTTYETMRDLEFAMASQPWSVMVCDEAQKIKNPAALVTRSAKKQKVRFRVACTGTPVENTLADLWCLFDFVQPGMLGALSHFSRTYRQPIEAKTPEQVGRVEELRKIIEPQILHRLKTDVVRDLPAAVEDEACKALPMSPYQHRLYEGALNALREQRDTNPSAQLQALQAIRKICSDPHGHAERETRSLPVQRLVNESPKLGWLVHHLKSLAADRDEDHKVIVFCEFRELQLVLQRVTAAFFGFAPSIVNGDTSADPRASENRQQLIDAFQRKPGFNVIILSPLAVGFGVNIQAANHVVHFTRTWNPAKEDQATARAHRIGQTRMVHVYYPGVVSEQFPSFDVRLDQLLSSKRKLATDILNGCSDLKAADFADFG